MDVQRVLFVVLVMIFVDSSQSESQVEKLFHGIGDDIDCASHLTSCDECVTNPKCMWCSSAIVKCMTYPAGDVIPSSDTCPLADARWGVCWVNYQLLLIAMGILSLVIIASCIACCYCCCCRRKTTPVNGGSSVRVLVAPPVGMTNVAGNGYNYQRFENQPA